MMRSLRFDRGTHYIMVGPAITPCLSALEPLAACSITQGLKGSSFLWQYIILPRKKIGHNQKGTTVELLGMAYMDSKALSSS